MDELDRQTKALYSLQEVEQKKFPKRIAFNVIPHIDVFMEDGFTKEEWKMMVETKKILDPKIKLTATCVRVPVFIGHSEAVNVEFEEPITADEAREILRSAPGVVVIDKREPGGYITPHEAAGEDATYVSRIREDFTVENGLAFWCVVRQPAQGRGAERRADRRGTRQSRAPAGETTRSLTRQDDQGPITSRHFGLLPRRCRLLGSAAWWLTKGNILWKRKLLRTRIAVAFSRPAAASRR